MNNFGIDLKIQIINSDAHIPTKAHSDDACFDLYSPIDATIPSHSTTTIPLGLKSEIPQNWWCAIFPRSGIATKKGLRLANLTGVIDAGYRDEWKLVLYNDSDKEQSINKGERIAQFMLLPVYPTNIISTENLDMTNDRGGGFGSSGE